MNKELNVLWKSCTEKQKQVQQQRDTGVISDNLVNPPSAKGICINCDDAEICKFSGFGDEVVFCEEQSSNFENARNDKESNKFYYDVPNLGAKNLIQG